MLVIVSWGRIAIAQCNFEKIERPDGKTAYRVENLVSGPVATSDDVQLAFTPSMIDGSVYVAGIYRWRSVRKGTGRDLRLVLKNGVALSIDRVSTQKTKAGGSLVSSVLYKLDNIQAKRLKESEVETINTKVSGNWLVMGSNERSDELKKGVECILDGSYGSKSTYRIKEKETKEISKYIKYVKNTIGYERSFISSGNPARFESYFAGNSQSAPINKLDPESIYVGRDHVKIYCEENPSGNNFLSCVTKKEGNIEVKTSSIFFGIDLGLSRSKRGVEKAFRKIIKWYK